MNKRLKNSPTSKRSVALGAFSLLMIFASLPVEAAPSYEFPRYLKASNTDAEDLFGYRMAADGDTLVVSAYFEDSAATGIDGDQDDNSASSSGSAYVFVRDTSGNWTQQAYLKASNTGTSDQLGFSVAISGDTIVVGAPKEDSGATGVNGDQEAGPIFSSGAAYVFVRSGTTWTQQAYLKASNTDSGDNFGISVAIDQDTIVVGADAEDSFATGVNGNQFDDTVTNAGAAYVFVRSGTTWSQQAYLKASNTEENDRFGEAVAVHGDRIAVAAKFEDSNATGIDGNQLTNIAEDSGAVYVFERSSTTWTQDGYIKASNTDEGDSYGASLGIFGEIPWPSAHDWKTATPLELAVTSQITTPPMSVQCTCMRTAAATGANKPISRLQTPMVWISLVLL